MSNTADSNGAGLTVLLAEDSVSVALLIQTLLERWGYAVVVKSCGEPALEALAAGRFDLVVIGATAPAAARIVAVCGSIPVLALVTEGYALPGAAAEVLLPFDAATLRDALHRCLDRPSADIDSCAIAALWGSTDNPVYRRVATAFVAEMRGRLARIETLTASDDLTGIELEAHSIKGAAANVCAHGVRDAAATLEAQAARGNGDSLSATIEILRGAVARVLRALEGIVG